MAGWLAGSHFGSKREANAKITHKSHQLQLVARNFSFGTFKDEQKILALPYSLSRGPGTKNLGKLPQPYSIDILISKAEKIIDKNSISFGTFKDEQKILV